MPTVSEISSGQQFQRSADENGLADSQTRVFKVLLGQPGETFDIQQTCGVFIGDIHPYNTNIYCKSFSANFEGNSRMVVLCTFQYQSTAGSDGGGNPRDPQQDPPDVRPANWSTSTSLMEAPAYSWEKVLTVTNNGVNADNPKPPVNPAGDIYDGVTKLVPVTTITIEQFEANDPTRHCYYAGRINSVRYRIGSLGCDPHTLMFRGVSSSPAVESWGNLVFRGWKCVYEFAYRPNEAHYSDTDGVPPAVEDVGWDILVPVSGFSVKAFTPPGNAAEDDPFGQPLKHAAGRIGIADDGLPVLPVGVNDGDKVRAMVKVHDYEDGGVSQTPSAQPVPLNENGRPRKADAIPAVLVFRYQVQPEMDFRSLGLRLQ